jgi:hypothetical protein
VSRGQRADFPGLAATESAATPLLHLPNALS